LRKPLQRFGPAIGWASLILIATSIPIPAALASASPTGADKLVHFGMYAMLAWLAVGASAPATTRAALTAFAMVAAFGVLDEWHQQFIPGRSMSVADLVADVVGGGVGVLAFQAAQRRRESVS
jgi:VanZ family protein